MKIFTGLPLLAACMLVAGCGGGSSTPVPTNQHPTLDLGTASVSVVENSIGTLLTATANDPDGDSLSFELSGDDAAFFSIDASGNLSFISPPNFDLHPDADGDNIYRLSVAVSDGRGGTAREPVEIVVTNDREGIAVTRILTGLSNPIGISASFVTDRRMAVGMADGSYVIFSGNRNASDPVNAPRVPFYTTQDFVRLLDLAWGPEGTYWEGPMFLYQTSFSFRVIRPGSGSRREGNFTFGNHPDSKGRLFIGSGDEAFAAIGDPTGEYAQSAGAPGDLNIGRIARLEGLCGASTLAICANRFGKGIRQPGGFVEFNGAYMLADQGGSVEHEINLFDFVFTEPPLNFGWPYLEGTVTLEGGAPTDLLQPSLTYDFGEGIKSGTGIVMGVVYDGPIESLDGMLVFADKDGSIYAVAAGSLEGSQILRGPDIELRTEDFQPDEGTIDQVIEIASDAAGFIYILDADGEVYRIDAN